MLNINGEKNIFISFWFYYDITAIALEAKIYQEILSSGQAEDVFSFFFFSFLFSSFMRNSALPLFIQEDSKVR